MSRSQTVLLACGHAVCGGGVLRMRSTYTEQTNHIDLTHDSGARSDGTLAPPSCPECRARISETVFVAAEVVATTAPATSATPGSNGGGMGGDALDSHAMPCPGNPL